MFRECLAIAVGGALGSLARFGLLVAFSLIGAAWLPMATLAANILGCLSIGWLAEWSANHQSTNQWWVIGIRVGLLGGLTTFSSFALDVVRLGMSERGGLAGWLILAHVASGIAAVVLGMALARQTLA